MSDEFCSFVPDDASCQQPKDDPKPMNPEGKDMDRGEKMDDMKDAWEQAGMSA